MTKRYNPKGTDFYSRLLETAMFGNYQGEGYPIKGKGHVGETRKHTTVTIPPSRTFARDRETNQLFILSEIRDNGARTEENLANPQYLGDKSKLPLYYTFKPLFFPNTQYIFSVSGGAEKDNLYGESSQFFGSTTLAVVEAHPSSGVNEYPLTTLDDRFLQIRTGLGTQYCPINSVDTNINLLSPFQCIKSNAPEPPKYSGTAGNFIYGSCAANFNIDRIVIGHPSGLYYADVVDNVVTSIRMAMPSNSKWCPLHLHTVLHPGDHTQGALYMTAIVSQVTESDYIVNPGYGTTNYFSAPITTSDGMRTDQYNGRVCVFKIPINNGLQADQITAVYSHFGLTYDTDFAPQATAYDQEWRTTGSSCDRNWWLYASESHHNSLVYNGGATPTRYQLSSDDMLVNFSFGVDSFWCRKEVVWEKQLFYVKKEEPFIKVFDFNGLFLKNIPLFGDGFPINSLRLRICGTYAEDTPPAEETTVSAPETVTEENPLACPNTLQYMRGGPVLFHCGYLTMDGDGNQILLKSWTATPWYITHLFHRTQMVPYTGIYDAGDLNPFASCGGDSGGWTWSVSQTLLNLCYLVGIGAYCSGGGLRFGTRTYTKYWDLEGTISLSGGGDFSLDYTPVTYYNIDGFYNRYFTRKNDTEFFIDTITGNSSLCSPTITMNVRKPPDDFFTELNDPANAVRDPMHLWNDQRRFGLYQGPKMNPQTAPVVNGNAYTIAGEDDFILTPMYKFNETRKSHKTQGAKTFTFNSAEMSSPYHYTLFPSSQYTLITLVKHDYFVEGDSTMTLRDFLEQQSPQTTIVEAGMSCELDDTTQNHNLLWMTSLDWGLYPPVGMSNIFPQDVSMYNGARTLAGVYIYEGYSEQPDGVSVDVEHDLNYPDGTPIYGGITEHPFRWERITVTRSVTFHFSIQGHTTTTNKYCPTTAFPRDCYKEYPGTIKETYLVAEK